MKKINIFLTTAILVSVIILCSGISMYAIKLQIKDDEINNLKFQLKVAERNVLEQYKINNNLYDTIKETDKSIKKLKADNKLLKSELDSTSDRLNTYEKYEYAVYDEEGHRTDLTYDEIKLGETLMIEKNLNPKLLFNIIMVETRANSSDTNKYSGAAGYGQFMSYTGKFVYENLMGMNSRYDHNTTPYDGEMNIRMMVTYLSYLYDKYDNNSTKVIKEYCGGDDSFTELYMNLVKSWTPEENVFSK